MEKNENVILRSFLDLAFHFSAFNIFFVTESFQAGNDGVPGSDAAYCPCPPRTGEAAATGHKQTQAGYRFRAFQAA